MTILLNFETPAPTKKESFFKKSLESRIDNINASVDTKITNIHNKLDFIIEKEI